AVPIHHRGGIRRVLFWLRLPDRLHRDAQQVARRNDRAPHRPLRLADRQMGMGRAADILRMNPAGDSAAKLLTRDRALRIAANIAKLPDLNPRRWPGPLQAYDKQCLSSFSAISVKVGASCTPRCASSMIFRATTRLAGSSINFIPNFRQMFSRASDICRTTSGSNAWPGRNWHIASYKSSVAFAAR